MCVILRGRGEAEEKSTFNPTETAQPSAFERALAVCDQAIEQLPLLKTLVVYDDFGRACTACWGEKDVGEVGVVLKMKALIRMVQMAQMARMEKIAPTKRIASLERSIHWLVFGWKTLLFLQTSHLHSTVRLQKNDQRRSLRKKTP